MNEIKKYSLGPTVYEFCFADDGLQMRIDGKAWMGQRLCWDNLRVLLETKNEASEKHPADLEAAQKAWREDLIARLKGKLPRGRRVRKATA